MALLDWLSREYHCISLPPLTTCDHPGCKQQPVQRHPVWKAKSVQVYADRWLSCTFSAYSGDGEQAFKQICPLQWHQWVMRSHPTQAVRLGGGGGALHLDPAPHCHPSTQGTEAPWAIFVFILFLTYFKTHGVVPLPLGCWWRNVSCYCHACATWSAFLKYFQGSFWTTPPGKREEINKALTKPLWWRCHGWSAYQLQITSP